MAAGVILFHSSNHAIWAAKLLAETGIEARLVPTPKQLSSECGHAVTIPAAAAASAEALLLRRHVPYDRYAALPE